MAERKDDTGFDELGFALPEPVKPAVNAASQSVIDAPKPDSILAIEKKYGKTLYPYYAQTQASREGMSQDYGPPIGYSFEDEKGQNVHFDTSGKFKEVQSRAQDLLPILGGIALSLLLPGIGEAIGNFLMDAGILTTAADASAAVITAGGTASEAAAAAKTALNVAKIAGTSIAKTTANIAQGQSPEDALKNAVVDVAVSSGSVPLAKDLNVLIKNPAITDAIVSAGGSAVKTAAAGGTGDDIARNMTAALAGSAVSSAYQSAGDDFTKQTGRMIGSGVAGYITNKEIGAVTGALGELGSQSKGKVSGAIEDTIKGTTDKGALPPSQVEALNPPTDAGPAALNKVEVTGKALAPDITSTNIIDTAVRTTPTTPPPPKLETVEVSGKALPKATDITDTDILDTIAKEKKADAELKRVEISGKKEEPLALETKTITGKADSTLAPVTITRKADEPAATPEEKAPEEKPYKPNLFILGGKKPKAPPSSPASDSVLSQALGTTTGLTAARGAGEIEDPSTGKKKRKVWNEETLRLKDALGV